MQRDPDGRNPMWRKEPSSLAKDAQARWIQANGGEEAIRRRIAVGGGPSEADLISMVERWRQAMLARGVDRIRANLANERLRKLRRARRLVLFGIWLCVADITAALFLVVWFGFLGHH